MQFLIRDRPCHIGNEGKSASQRMFSVGILHKGNHFGDRFVAGAVKDMPQCRTQGGIDHLIQIINAIGKLFDIHISLFSEEIFFRLV